MPAVDVWERQAAISRALGAWAVGSIGAGIACAVAGQVTGRPALRAFGVQSAGWGAIDLAIAVAGDLRRRSRMLEVPDAADPDLQEAERATLRRILLVNAALDVGYVGAGVAGAARSWRGAAPDGPVPGSFGHWSAVAIQGGYLLGFDLWQAHQLP